MFCYLAQFFPPDIVTVFSAYILNFCDWKRPQPMYATKKSWPNVNHVYYYIRDSFHVIILGQTFLLYACVCKF